MDEITDPGILDTLVGILSRNASAAGDRMSGMFLPPEQRSVMPGVNELQARQQTAAGKPPYVGPDLFSALFSSLPAMSGMAKTFKPSSQTIESTISNLANEGRGFNLNSLQAALQNTSNGDVMMGGYGVGGHGPVYDAMPVSWQHAAQRGFAIPDLGQKGFLPDTFASALQNPNMVKLASRWLQQGKPLSDVIRDINAAASFGMPKPY